MNIADVAVKQITVWNWHIAAVTNADTRSTSGERSRNVFRCHRSAYHWNAGRPQLTNIQTAPRRYRWVLTAQTSPALAMSTGAITNNTSISPDMPYHVYACNWALPVRPFSSGMLGEADINIPHQPFSTESREWNQVPSLNYVFRWHAAREVSMKDRQVSGLSPTCRLS